MTISLTLTGCQRGMAPNPTNPNSSSQPGKISAAKTRADYYNGIVTDNVSARTGMNGSAPINYMVRNGQTIRIVGKYDGNYVAILPNNQIGLVPIDSTKPASPGSNQTAKNVPAPPPAVPGGTATGRVTSSPAVPPSSTAGNVPAGEASTMINLVNQARSQAGLTQLNSDGTVTNLANMKAADIAKNNYFSHNSPTYGSPFDMMKNNGVSYLYAGENLAINANVQAAETALMNSPDHKANIMNPNFTNIGVGVAQKSDGSRVYVQMFIGR